MTIISRKSLDFSVQLERLSIANSTEVKSTVQGRCGIKLEIQLLFDTVIAMNIMVSFIFPSQPQSRTASFMAWTQFRICIYLKALVQTEPENE